MTIRPALRSTAVACLAAASLWAWIAPAVAETAAEQKRRCDNQCRPLLSAGYPAKETRRIVHNCLTLCKGKRNGGFYICPDGIGYDNIEPDECPKPRNN